VSRWLAWVNGCVNLDGYGVTAGDTMYCGFRNYSEPFPCPNGLEEYATDPRESVSYRNRIAKAKRDIEEFDRDGRVRALALVLKPKQIEDDIKDIKQWLKSLFTPPSASGSHESNQAAVS